MKEKDHLTKKTILVVILIMLSLNVLMYGQSKANTEILNSKKVSSEGSFPIVGTNQSKFFDDATEITTQSEGDDYYGQNANYPGTTPSYEDNGDGTVTDMVTGLMWQSSFDHNGDGSIDYDDKLGYADILDVVNSDNTGGYTDWRVPTIKEMYSLMMFSGRDISSVQGTDTDGLIPFVNTEYFDFDYGDTDAMERLIDVQCATTAVYVSDEVDETVFGVNLADGRIKGYGTDFMGQDKMFNYLLVRGSETYGINEYTDNGDGTITDAATGLMWMQDDIDSSMLWTEALPYAENFEYADYNDWRLPDAKELHSILDYTKSPATTNSATIDDLFNSTVIENEAGEDDYPWYWSSTTHESESDDMEGGWGVYLAFGRCMGNNGTETWTDVHGAGAQRSDPKGGDPDEFADGHGPQGDAVRIYNYVRLVRYTNVTGINDAESNTSDIPTEFNLGENYPNPFNPSTQITVSIPESGDYSLRVYNLLGQEVATLLSDEINAGTHTFSFDASHLTSGIYFYNFSGNNFTETKKMMLLK